MGSGFLCNLPISGPQSRCFKSYETTDLIMTSLSLWASIQMFQVMWDYRALCIWYWSRCLWTAIRLPNFGINNSDNDLPDYIIRCHNLQAFWGLFSEFCYAEASTVLWLWYPICMSTDVPLNQLSLTVNTDSSLIHWWTNDLISCLSSAALGQPVRRPFNYYRNFPLLGGPHL